MNAMTHQGAILSLAVLSLTIFATSERVIGEETDRYDRVTVIPTGDSWSLPGGAAIEPPT